MSAELTLILWVEGRDEAEKAVDLPAGGAVPRIGELVQLGPYGGPYEWRRVTDVTWRHGSAARGGVSALVLLEARASARGERDADGEAPRKPQKSSRRDDGRQPSLLDDPQRK